MPPSQEGSSLFLFSKLLIGSLSLSYFCNTPVAYFAGQFFKLSSRKKSVPPYFLILKKLVALPFVFLQSTPSVFLYCLRGQARQFLTIKEVLCLINQLIPKGLSPIGKTKIFSALSVGSLENILFIKLLWVWARNVLTADIKKLIRRTINENKKTIFNL